MVKGAKSGMGAGSKAMGGTGKKMPMPQPPMAGGMPGGGAGPGSAFKKGGPVKKDNPREERAEKKADKASAKKKGK